MEVVAAVLVVQEASVVVVAVAVPAVEAVDKNELRVTSYELRVTRSCYIHKQIVNVVID